MGNTLGLVHTGGYARFKFLFNKSNNENQVIVAFNFKFDCS